MRYLIEWIRSYPDITILMISFLTGLGIAVITHLAFSLRQVRSAFTQSESQVMDLAEVVCRLQETQTTFINDLNQPLKLIPVGISEPPEIIHVNGHQLLKQALLQIRKTLHHYQKASARLTRSTSEPLIISRFEVPSAFRALVDLFRKHVQYPAITINAPDGHIYLWADRDKIETMLFSYLYSRLTTSPASFKSMTILMQVKSMPDNDVALDLLIQCTSATDKIWLPTGTHILTYRFMKMVTELHHGDLTIRMDSNQETIHAIIPGVESNESFRWILCEN